MTRGKILFIDTDGKLYSSIEFNGDMYPDGKGDQIIENFENGYFQNFQCYERFIERFNRRNFGYEVDLLCIIQENPTIHIGKNWTDYLYIINHCKIQNIVIVDDNDNQTELPLNAMAIVYFQEVKQIVHGKSGLNQETK